MSKFASFAKGYGLGTKMAEDYEEAQMKKELKGLAEAEVQTTGGQEANPAQVQQQLDAGAGMGEARTLAGARQPSQYTHLGKTQDTPFTEQQKAQNQTLAMAQVIKKRDPMRGLQLEQAAKNQERADTEFGWKAGDREREEKKRQGIESANLESANYLKSLTNPDGSTRAPTIDDLIEAQSKKTHALAGAGHMDEALNAQSLVWSASAAKIKNETDERDKAFGDGIAALRMGNPEPIQKAYKKFVPDNASATEIKLNKDGTVTFNRTTNQGVALAPETMKMDDFVAGVVAMKDPKYLLDFSMRQREMQLKDAADKRDEKRLGLQSAQTAASIEHSKATTATQKAQLKNMSLADQIVEKEKAIGRPLSQEEKEGLVLGLKDSMKVDIKEDGMGGVNIVGLNPRTMSGAVTRVDGSGKTTETKFGRSTAPQPKGLPAGAKQVGTSGGKPVYELPDGSRVIQK